MLNVSYAYEKKISELTKVLVKADIDLANGSTLHLEGDDFVMGGIKIDEAVSSSGSFDIGAAIIGQCTVTLNNYDDRFSDCDFTAARITPSVGVELDDGTVEWLRKGVYWLDQPSAMPSTIQLTALDNMSKLARDYSEVPTHYPATLRTIVQDACNACGVVLAKATFPNSDYSVPARPDDSALTCLDVVSAAAQAAGCWAKMDNMGRLVLSWYDLKAYEGEDWLDGGLYDEGYTISPYADIAADPYATGDTADGGDFFIYGGSLTDGGTFDNRRFAIVHAISSSTIVTDDVVVTGVRVTAQDGEEDGKHVEGESALYGTEGYVLAFEGNPLVPCGKAAEVATRVGPRVVGMRFRPFDLTALGSPAYEAGDPILVVDARQNVYRSFITSLTWKAGSYQSFSCSAETPARNSAKGYSAATKNVVKLRNELRRETTERELAVKALAERLAQNSGLYMTREEGASGGTVYYMHDKPTLGESRCVWKMTADAIGISTDGGETYPYGLNVDGDAILERIYAVGIDADYITTGSFEVKKNGVLVFKADKDAGEVYVNADRVTIGEVRKAFANDTSSVTVSAGTVTFNAGTFVCNGENFKVDASGNLTAKNANVSGRLTSTSVNGDKVEMNSGRLDLYGQTSEVQGTISIVPGYDILRIESRKSGVQITAHDKVTIGAGSGKYLVLTPSSLQVCEDNSTGTLRETGINGWHNDIYFEMGIAVRSR